MNIQGEPGTIAVRAAGAGVLSLGLRKETVEERAGFLETWGMGDLRRVQPSLGPALLNFSCLPCSDSGSQPGGVPSAPTGPLGPPGHGQTLGKNEAIGAG